MKFVNTADKILLVPFWRKEGGAVKDDVPTDIGENNEAMELECESVDQVSPPIIDQKSPIIDHKSLSVDQKLTSVDQKSPPVDQGSSCLDPRKVLHVYVIIIVCVRLINYIIQ